MTPKSTLPIAYSFLLRYTDDMSELTHQDVQRIVQDATRTLQGDLQRLTGDISSVAQQAQWIDDIQRSLQQLQAEVSRHDPRSEQTMQQLTRDVQDLKRRFEVVERFCRDMSEYFQARATDDREDRQYRSVGN